MKRKTRNKTLPANQDITSRALTCTIETIEALHGALLLSGDPRRPYIWHALKSFDTTKAVVQRYRDSAELPS
jgi:hypothetical protein